MAFSLQMLRALVAAHPPIEQGGGSGRPDAAPPKTCRKLPALTHPLRWLPLPAMVFTAVRRQATQTAAIASPG